MEIEKKLNLFENENSLLENHRASGFIKEVQPYFDKVQFDINKVGVHQQVLLMALNNDNIEDVWNIADKYCFRYEFYPLELITKIAENREDRDFMIMLYKKANLLKEYHVKENGEVYLDFYDYSISFYKADVYFKQNDKIVNYIKVGDRSCNCHTSAMFLLENIPKATALTAKCKNTFGTEYYHSYCKVEDFIINLNNNIVIKEDYFNLLYNPKVISSITYEEYNKNYKDLKSGNVYSLLYIALLRENN